MDNFFSSRSSLDPLLITIYISPSTLYCNFRFLFIKDPYCSCSYQIVFKTWKCHTTQLPVATIMPSAMFFVLPVESKEFKKCRSLLNGDSALSASTREPTLHTLAPTLNCWKSFLLLLTFQLNSHCFLFHLPPALTFTLKLLVYILGPGCRATLYYVKLSTVPAPQFPDLLFCVCFNKTAATDLDMHCMPRTLCFLGNVVSLYF